MKISFSPKNRFFRLSAGFTFFIAIISCFLVVVNGQDNLTSSGIIPAPQSVFFTGTKCLCESFVFDPDDISSPWLKNLILNTEGLSLKKGAGCQVKITLDKHMDLNEYSIQIHDSKVSISAGGDASLQHAFLSFIQLVEFHKMPLPEITIKDKPVFSYRGMHLDVSRHFFTIDEIKQYIDFLTYYKFNYFHWHLTDDQGWRMEIKQFPKLTQIGGYRKETLVGHYNDQPVQYDGKRYGGYYTQDEIREIIAYSLDRKITVVPEIEMPGHARAALAAYPELSCTGLPMETATTWGVFDDVFCPSENTFVFLEKVLDEVSGIFPGPYIHIGGDECPKTRWLNTEKGKAIMEAKGISTGDSLQSYFIQRISSYLASKGKKIIGWDEILEGGLADDATVMSWRGVQGGLEAAREKHDVIMTPGSHCYFDHYQSTSAKEPLAIGGFTSLKKVYHWQIIPDELSMENHKYILGGQGNVWTEYIPEFSHVEYMAFARAMALSEVLWGSNKNYQSFTQRFLVQAAMWKAQGVNISNKVFELKPKIEAGKGKPVSISFSLPNNKQVWHEWGMLSEKGTVFQLKEKGLHHFIVENAIQNQDDPLKIEFYPHLGTQCKINMNPIPSEKYPGNGPGSIVNGVYGSDVSYGGLEWLGFAGRDVQVMMEWKEPQDISNISMRFFKGEGQWIYLPSSVEVYASQDGKVFEKIKSLDQIDAENKVARVNIPAVMKAVRFIKIHVNHFGKIPEGRQGAGHGAWLFLDEIVVE